MDVEFVFTTLGDEEEADDGVAIEEDFGVSVLEVFAASSVPVVLESLWGNETVLSSEGEEFLRVLAAEGGEGPALRELSHDLLVAERLRFCDFARDAEGAVGLGDGEVALGQGGKEQVFFDEWGVESKRRAEGLLSLRLELRQEFVEQCSIATTCWETEVKVEKESGIAFLGRSFPVGEDRDNSLYGSLLDADEKLGMSGHGVTFEASFGAAKFVRVSGADFHELRSIRNRSQRAAELRVWEFGNDKEKRKRELGMLFEGAYYNS